MTQGGGEGYFLSNIDTLLATLANPVVATGAAEAVGGVAIVGSVLGIPQGLQRTFYVGTLAARLTSCPSEGSLTFQSLTDQTAGHGWSR